MPLVTEHEVASASTIGVDRLIPHRNSFAREAREAREATPDEGRTLHARDSSLWRPTPAEFALQAIAGTTFHTHRRTVGTLIAHEASLDAARDQLGHQDPSVTLRHYVGARATAPDLRTTLDRLVGG